MSVLCSFGWYVPEFKKLVRVTCNKKKKEKSDWNVFWALESTGQGDYSGASVPS
jgi:hypothetical protein